MARLTTDPDPPNPDQGTEEYEAKREELMDAWRDAYFERAKKRRVRAKERNPQSGELGFAAQPLRQPVPVHAPRFPYERHEQWMILLVDVKSNPNKLVGYQKLSQNTRKEKVQLKFLAPNEGTVNYEVHAICSSYLGADKKVRTKTDRTLTLNLDLSRDPPTLTLTL